MKKIDIPKIVRPLDLKEYAAEMGGSYVFYVWINPPKRMLDEHQIYTDMIIRGGKELMQNASQETPEDENLASLVKEEILASVAKVEEAKRILYQWYSEIWS